MNLDSGTNEDRFQSVVRPTGSPPLSQQFNSTGIPQEVVNHQEAFPDVYAKLANWIERIQTEKNLRFASPSQRNADSNGVNATFCTWSDIDLKLYFKMECLRLDISALSCFKTWIDVRQSFNVSELWASVAIKYLKILFIKNHQLFSPLQRVYALEQCKFTEALQYAGIHTMGQAKSAINDAVNLAKLVVNLNKRGAQFKVTTNYCDHSTPVDYSYWKSIKWKPWISRKITISNVKLITL